MYDFKECNLYLPTQQIVPKKMRKIIEKLG